MKLETHTRIYTLVIWSCHSLIINQWVITCKVSELKPRIAAVDTGFAATLQVLRVHGRIPALCDDFEVGKRYRGNLKKWQIMKVDFEWLKIYEKQIHPGHYSRSDERTEPFSNIVEVSGSKKSYEMINTCRIFIYSILWYTLTHKTYHLNFFQTEATKSIKAHRQKVQIPKQSRWLFQEFYMFNSSQIPARSTTLFGNNILKG